MTRAGLVVVIGGEVTPMHDDIARFTGIFHFFTTFLTTFFNMFT